MGFDCYKISRLAAWLLLDEIHIDYTDFRLFRIQLAFPYQSSYEIGAFG